MEPLKKDPSIVTIREEEKATQESASAELIEEAVPAFILSSDEPKARVTKSTWKPPVKSQVFVLFNAKDGTWGKIKKCLETMAGAHTAEQVLDVLAEIYLVLGKAKRHDTDQFPILKKLLAQHAEDKAWIGLFPFIAQQALKVESYFPDGELPLLQSNQSCCILREAVVSLVANCFLGTFSESKFKDLPTPQDFTHIFQNEQPIFYEKLKFYFHYFRTVQSEVPKGRIVISRRALPSEVEKDPEYVTHSRSLLLPAEVREEAKIEEVEGALQVDFANKFIGGGCMKAGAVQEEILFLICPELLAARMVNLAMKDTEAIFIRGVQRYANYSGYAHACKFAGSFHDKLADELTSDKDVLKREFVALDALKFRTTGQQLLQFNKKTIDREIRKAIVGFTCGLIPAEVATGRWGCGAFKGNAQLKFLLQWIAASFCGRKMIFCSMGDKALKPVSDIVAKYGKQPIGGLYKRVLEIGKNYAKRNERKVEKKMPIDFETFLFQSLLSSHDK